MNVLLQGRIAVDQHALFDQLKDDSWTTLVWNPLQHNSDEFAELAKSADVIVGGNIPLDSWPSVPALKLFQIPWAGYNFTSPERMPAGVPVANCYEHESAIAEYVMLAILEWQIGLRIMDERFRREGWGGRYPAGGIFHQEVRGKTLGIVGYGHIGEAIATRANAFDMSIIATRRTQCETPEPLQWLGTEEQLPLLLEQSDFIVLACDLNDATRDLINADTLAQMKSGAVVINVSRGEVIEEDALYEVLKSKRIGGAVLDVWYNYNQVGQPEVWPSNKPFHELDNVILSAHECCWTEAQGQRRWQAVVENIRRIEAGVSPENVVFHGEALTG